MGRAVGRAGGSLAISSTESGNTSETAISDLNIVNFDVRQAIANAERSATLSHSPHQAFSTELSEQILGKDGLRNRYLREADGGRGTFDINAPVTSLEQSSLLLNGRLSSDPESGPTDGNKAFKARD